MSFIATVVSKIGVPALVQIGSSLFGGYSANKAADKQGEAAQRDAELRLAMFNTQNAQMQPFRQSGYESLDEIRRLQPYLNKQYTAEDFRADPGYQFRLQQGGAATQNVGNQAGGAISGNTLKAMMDYNQNSSATEFGAAFNRDQTQKSNIFNRLTNIAGLGANVVNAGATASNAAAEGIGQAYTNQGAADASRYIGTSNAITGGANTYAKYNYLASLLEPSGGAPTPTDMTGFKTNSPATWNGSSANAPQPFQFLTS
jgi:hypothetical protein